MKIIKLAYFVLIRTYNQIFGNMRAGYRDLFTLFSLLVLFIRHCNSSNYTMFIIIIDRKELKMKSVHAELNPGGKPKVDFVSFV